jgi:hypothetical protein
MIMESNPFFNVDLDTTYMNTVNPIIAECRDAIYNKGENRVVLFTGKVRRGKSLCAWKFCRDVVGSFSNKYVIYDFKPFLHIMKDPNSNQQAILIEEMGVKADKKRFMTFINSAIRYVLQTSAHKCNLLCMTVPSRGDIDGDIINSVSYQLDATKSDKKNGLLKRTLFDVWLVQHNSKEDKTYQKHPRYYVDGEINYLTDMWLYPPEESIIQEYLRYSIPYKNQILAGLEDRLTEMENKAEQKASEKVKAIDEDMAMAQKVLANKEAVSTRINGLYYPFVTNKIAALLDVGVGTAKKIKTKAILLEKEGSGKMVNV